MALELRQQLKLSQQLVMTPQLQQAIKLLQLSRVELLETVNQELLENPFLEEKMEEPSSEQEDVRNDSSEQIYEKELAKDADWEDYLGEFASTPRTSTHREHESLDEMGSYEARYVAKPTLEGHLMWQLRLSQLNVEQMEIGEVIIANLASSGYLHSSLEDIAILAESSVEEVHEVLHYIQLFDPIGVASRNARECLLVQIKALRYDRDAILVSLVTEHLEDLESRRYKPLLRKFKIDFEELKEYLDIIQSLDPLPGSSFGGAEPTYVSPDVFVYKLDNEFVILLNEDGLPQLQLSTLYGKNDFAGSTQDSDYSAEKIRSASWLIKSLYQRQRTLYKVVESIVKHQKSFFEDGVSSFAPLILKDIADDIEMHESTVSRITTNKYVATPHGVFELKFFFNSYLVLDDGTQVGSESVKALIKKFISEEEAKSPLSDERISEMLKENLGVSIARRTVAKYRMAMNISSSSKRKKHF